MLAGDQTVAENTTVLCVCRGKRMVGSDQPGREEQAELSREDRRQARDEVSDRVGADAAEFDDGEETVDELLEIDHTELDELGLTLDDPHQPEPE